MIKTHSVRPGSGIISDETIRYNSKKNKARNLKPLRKVVFIDPETGKELTFTTNHFRWSANTIAAIYKQRWQIELFFKWIKQSLKISGTAVGQTPFPVYRLVGWGGYKRSNDGI